MNGFDLFILFAFLACFFGFAIYEYRKSERLRQEEELRCETIKNSLQDIAEYLRQISSDITNR